MSKIALGKAGNRTVMIDLPLLLRTRAFIQGNSGSGKTHTLQEIIEQIFGKVQVIVIDLEGDFSILRKKFDFLLVGKGGDTPADCRSAALLARKLLELGTSAICDLYEMKPAERHRWVKLFLESMIDAPKNLWHPVVVVIDEIHIVCPEKGVAESEAKDAVIDLATRGRKRGFCLIGASQRIGKFAKDALAELLNVMVGMTFMDIDVERAIKTLGIPKSEEKEFTKQVKTMDEGNFFVLGRAISKERLLVKVNDVIVKRPKSHGGVFATPPPTSKIKALLPKLGDLPKEAEARAKTEVELRAEIRDLSAKLAAAQAGVRWKQPTPEKPKVEWKVVDIPAFKPKDILRVERLLQKMDQAAGKFQDLFGSVRSFSDGMKATLTKIEQAKRGLNVTPPAPQSTLFRTPPPVVKTPKPAPRPEPDDVNTGVDEDGGISPKQKSILTALAEFAAIGRQSVPRKWVAARSNASHKSSSFANNLSTLRTKGFIEYEGSAMIRLSDSGYQFVGQTPELNAAEMKESCIKLLSPKQRLIFEALYESYPNSMSREDLAAAGQASPASSSYANNLSSIRSAGMIEERRDGLERLSDWVMVENMVQA